MWWCTKYRVERLVHLFTQQRKVHHIMDYKYSHTDFISHVSTNAFTESTLYWSDLIEQRLHERMPNLPVVGMSLSDGDPTNPQPASEVRTLYLVDRDHETETRQRAGDAMARVLQKFFLEDKVTARSPVVVIFWMIDSRVVGENGEMFDNVGYLVMCRGRKE